MKQEEESQSLAEETQAVPGQPRLFIRIRLPKRETDTVKDDDSSDVESLEKEEEEESYQEDSSSESGDESEDEYIPPRKRQRTCFQAISKRSSSRIRFTTSASTASTNKAA